MNKLNVFVYLHNCFNKSLLLSNIWHRMSHYYFHQKLFYDSAHAYSSFKFKNRKIVPCYTVSQTDNINLVLIFIVQGSMSRKSLDGQSNHTSVPEIDIKVCLSYSLQNI